jgi:hypothetical protein
MIKASLPFYFDREKMIRRKKWIKLKDKITLGVLEILLFM